MWRKILDELSGRNCEFKERMFRAVILAGGVTAIVAILEILFVNDISAVIVSMLFLLLIAMAISLFATFRYSRYDVAAFVLGIIIIAFIFPVMFIQSAALNSGADVWLALGFGYIFIMFSGKRQLFFCILCVLVYGGTYLYALANPEAIVPMASERLAYLDSYFSVIAVGFLVGSILKLQSKVFEKEHKLNLQQKEALEKSSNAKNVFFANMSHELRTPITAIIGLNEMIMRENVSEATLEYAKNIEQASKLLLNQINDILDLSQIEIQKMHLVPAPYHTKELLGELVDMIRVRMKNKNLDLFLDIDRNIPTELFGDVRRLQQIYLNILDNAVKYTEEGSVTLSVSAEPGENDVVMLQVKVADTGIGIRKEDLEHIYDSFSRVDEKNHTGIIGSGLGLAITKELVHMMQGEIAVDSIYTKGSVFTVTIPQKVVNPESIGDINLLDKEINGMNSYQPCFEAPEVKGLIVDDNAVISMVISKLLTDTKVKVDIANSGQECLALTMKKQYHVILMDCMMSRMNGTETLQAVRGQENGLCRETPVIALTANALAGTEQKYRELGFDGYLEKPVHGKALEEEILRLLPPELIEYQTDENPVWKDIHQEQKVAVRKRKKVLITTDCVCDLPSDLIHEYEIEKMYLYIVTPHGRFADTKEIDSDSLTQYVSATKTEAYVDDVTVEEYEEFFAEALTRAEQVVHISMASNVDGAFHNATVAAKGFDHVAVVDSGQISCGQSLLTLYAAKLAKEGKSAGEIYEAIEKKKANVGARFILPTVDIYYQNKHTNLLNYVICRGLQLHLLVGMRQKNLAVIALYGGSLERVWRIGIKRLLRRKNKIDPSVVIISHVGGTVEQLDWIKKEVQRYVTFEQVIVQKVSFSVACNLGLGTIGIACFTK